MSQTNAAEINTDVVIIGAGPAGLFTVFELGLLISKHTLSTSYRALAANAPSSTLRNQFTTFLVCPWLRAKG